MNQLYHHQRRKKISLKHHPEKEIIALIKLKKRKMKRGNLKMQMLKNSKKSLRNGIVSSYWLHF